MSFSFGIVVLIHCNFNNRHPNWFGFSSRLIFLEKERECLSLENHFKLTQGILESLHLFEYSLYRKLLVIHLNLEEFYRSFYLQVQQILLNDCLVNPHHQLKLLSEEVGFQQMFLHFIMCFLIKLCPNAFPLLILKLLFLFVFSFKQIYLKVTRLDL